MAGAFSSAFSSAFSGGYDGHDGGWYSADEIRKRLKWVEEANEKSAKKRRDAEKFLSDELDRAYRRLVLNEPEIAAEVVAAVTQSVVPAYEELPTINWRALADVAATARAVIEIFERDRRLAAIAAAEEDDIEVLLMAAF